MDKHQLWEQQQRVLQMEMTNAEKFKNEMLIHTALF